MLSFLGDTEIYAGDEILQGVSALKPTHSYKFSLKYSSEGAVGNLSDEISITMPESGKQTKLWVFSAVDSLFFKICVLNVSTGCYGVYFNKAAGCCFIKNTFHLRGKIGHLRCGFKNI